MKTLIHNFLLLLIAFTAGICFVVLVSKLSRLSVSYKKQHIPTFEKQVNQDDYVKIEK